MPRTLKRRSDAISRDASPRPDSPQPTQRRRRSPSASSAEGSHSGADDATQSNSQTKLDTLVKKLVRLALAAEYSRIPLRRGDISTKILNDANAQRSFKDVFAGAQKVLKGTFGMQMMELPSRDKTILKDRRTQATQTKTSAGTSSKSWVLISVLSEAYKTNPAILQPTKAPSQETEASYTALYTLVVTLIYLNNGSIPEAKLERYMERMNAEKYTPIGTLDKVLQRMKREGYVDQKRDTSSGEEVVEWIVGPRGKVEVGAHGAAGLVKTVYGHGAVGLAHGDAVKEEEDELNGKIERSLGITPPTKALPANHAEENGDADVDAEGGQEEQSQQQQQRQPRRSGRRRTAAQDDDDEG